MIKRFRRRFIFITMVLVGVVSLCAFIAIGVMGFQQVKSVTDQALSRAVEEGAFDDAELLTFGSGVDGQGVRESSVPVYVVSVNLTTMVYDVGKSSTMQMDEATASEAISAVSKRAERGQDSGALRDMGLYYHVRSSMVSYEVNGVTTSYDYLTIAFADSSLVLDDLGERFSTLAVFWVLLMAAVFIITIVLSRFVAGPVENAWKEQQRFIADASHELKTPLTVILADASILQQDKGKTIAEQQAWVEGIEVEAGRMQQLTENLLTLAQDDAGVDTHQLMGSVDLSSLVEGQILQFDAVAFERELAIEQDIEDGLTLQGDELRLESMVKTLLENACKYAGGPGSIDVRLRRVKNNAVLTVSNDGSDIPPEDLPHIFDRFYRSDKARANESNSASFGLGLSIAKSTVELHGGTIAVESGGGLTTFTVKIPLSK